jgi:hypothetical protein
MANQAFNKNKIEDHINPTELITQQIYSSLGDFNCMSNLGANPGSLNFFFFEKKEALNKWTIIQEEPTK